MNNKFTEIFEQYKKGTEFKSALGNKGVFEQSKINERFFVGDQWYGAKCGNERPLVRHNVIKRIGDYKMSQILNRKIAVTFSAEGMPSVSSPADTENAQALKEAEINQVMTDFSNYYDVTAERVNFEYLCSNILRNAYISGTAVLYTYWEPSVKTGLFADGTKNSEIKGDLCCEILKIEDVVFGDPYCENLQEQPFVIISSRQETETVLREARLHGADLTTLSNISDSAQDGKVTVFTKLFKEYSPGGSYVIKGIKVTEKAVVRPEFSTELRMYPLAVMRWENKNCSAYGESEITYLIPNQIAINRMITANVWSAMTAGMPIMLVNGDTVSEKITNDPGQIIKIYGSNEDVAGAVKYVSPVTSIREFDDSINTLINHTLTQSGANEVALGDSKPENATALAAMQNAALMPLQIVRGRYHAFIEDVARIWADFWITHYGKRRIKCVKEGVCRYIPFNGDDYRKIIISTKVNVNQAADYNDRERLETLLNLYDKGIINRKQLLCRIPDGMVTDVKTLLNEEVTENDGI